MIQITEKGLWYIEPVLSVITDLQQEAKLSPDKETSSLESIKALKRAIGAHTVWHTDDQGNLMPDDMDDKSQQVIAARAKNSLVESLPEAVGRHESSAQWFANRSVIAGAVILDAVAWGSIFKIDGQCLQDTTMQPTGFLGQKH